MAGHPVQACLGIPGFTVIPRAQHERGPENRRAAREERELHFDEAQSLFLAGKELEEISELLPVSL